VGTNARHVGLLYKIEKSPAFICHLAWHCMLLNELPDTSYAWIQSELDETNRQVIALAVAAMAERNDVKISYSTIYEGIYFKKGTLTYTRGQPADGLTCATFVLEIFATFGIDLLERSSWPRRSADDEWQLEIVRRLEAWGQNRGDQDVALQVEAIRSRPLGVRYRPEERCDRVYRHSS
jgi:hypothetical protein